MMPKSLSEFLSNVELIATDDERGCYNHKLFIEYGEYVRSHPGCKFKFMIEFLGVKIYQMDKYFQAISTDEIGPTISLYKSKELEQLKLFEFPEIN
jgi:hypothetical protein